MYIASKFEEIYALKFSTVYEKIAHKKLSKNEIIEKEAKILKALDFKLCIATPFNFLTFYIE